MAERWHCQVHERTMSSMAEYEEHCRSEHGGSPISVLFETDDEPETDDIEEVLHHYTAALDEVYALRSLLASEARVIEAHLGYKTFPKSRRPVAERQVERMQSAARGQGWEVYVSDIGMSAAKRWLRHAGAQETLTRSEWESRGG